MVKKSKKIPDKAKNQPKEKEEKEEKEEEEEKEFVIEVVPEIKDVVIEVVPEFVQDVVDVVQEAAQEVVPESVQDVVLDIVQEAVQEVVVPEAVQEVVPEIKDVVIEVVPEIKDVVIDIVPESVQDIVLDIVPEAVQEVVPEAVQVVVPEAVQEVVVPEAVQEVVPEIKDVSLKILFVEVKNDINLLEWVEHHLRIGFSHIYMIDYGYCKNLPKDKLTIIKSSKHVQDILFQARKFSLKYGFNWVIYLNTNEYLGIDNLSHFLQAYNEHEEVDMKPFIKPICDRPVYFLHLKK